MVDRFGGLIVVRTDLGEMFHHDAAIDLKNTVFAPGQHYIYGSEIDIDHLGCLKGELRKIFREVLVKDNLW